MACLNELNVQRYLEIETLALTELGNGELKAVVPNVQCKECPWMAFSNMFLPVAWFVSHTVPETPATAVQRRLHAERPLVSVST
ncbi:hypothetical protein HYE68_003965 [Fusarium pseudograminearum]|nr:hypothetical protein HYE68_003965 [Fusarium pseudograminearum]